MRQGCQPLLWKQEVPKVDWCLLLFGWLVFNNLERILKVFFIVFCVYICRMCGSVGACVLHSVCMEKTAFRSGFFYGGI